MGKSRSGKFSSLPCGTVDRLASQGPVSTGFWYLRVKCILNLKPTLLHQALSQGSWWMGPLFGLACRRLCPCVLKFEDNSTELASLIKVNKKYQVSRERVPRLHSNCCVVSSLCLENQQTLRLCRPRLCVMLPLTSLQI